MRDLEADQLSTVVGGAVPADGFAKMLKFGKPTAWKAMEHLKGWAEQWRYNGWGSMQGRGKELATGKLTPWQTIQ
jgi:hypothetical protein